MCGGGVGIYAATAPDQQSLSFIGARNPGCSGTSAVSRASPAARQLPTAAQACRPAQLPLGRLVAWAPVLSRSLRASASVAAARCARPGQQAVALDLRGARTAASAQAYRQRAGRLGRLQLLLRLRAWPWQRAFKLGQQPAARGELALQQLPQQQKGLEGRQLLARSLLQARALTRQAQRLLSGQG